MAHVHGAKETAAAVKAAAKAPEMAGMMGGSKGGMGMMGGMGAGATEGMMGGMGMMGSGEMGSMMRGMGMMGGEGGMGRMMGMGAGAGEGMMGGGMSMMGGRGMGSMMEGMGTMGMMEGGHMMANMPAMAECTEMAAKGAVAGAALSATSNPGSGFLTRVFRNPWVLFGLGVAAGFLVHKYRKEIIAAAAGITGGGQGVGSEQPENLEDLVAECGECAEETGPPKTPNA